MFQKTEASPMDFLEHFFLRFVGVQLGNGSAWYTAFERPWVQNDRPTRFAFTAGIPFLTIG